MDSTTDAEKENKLTCTSATDEYMKQLRQWSEEKNKYYWMWHHYLTMQTHVLHLHMMRQVSSNTGTSPNPVPNQQQQQPPPQPNTPQNKEYVIPSLLKRGFAETADFLILLILKTVGLVYVMNLLGLNFYAKSNEIMGLKLLKLLQEDLYAENWDDAFEEYFSDEDLKIIEEELSMLLSVTMLYRILTGFYEWLFIWLLGFTPGKLLFGLRVVSCTTAMQARPGMLIVAPGTRVSCASALMRSFLKNILISFMIPAFVTALFNPYKRTTYDELSRTIVVQYQPAARNR